MPFTIDRDLTTGGGALIKKQSHWRFNLFSGSRLPPEFAGPIRFAIDVDSEGRRMPTFFMVPAFVARRAFHEVLLSAGVDNIEAYPTLITNPETGDEITEYVYLNIVGRVQCADLNGSDTRTLAPGVNLIDRLAVDGSRLPSLHMFRLLEDELTIVISDHLHSRLRVAGFDDVYFGPVDVR